MDDRDFTPLGLLNTNFQGAVPVNNDEFYVPVGQPLQIRLQARQQRDNPSTWFSVTIIIVVVVFVFVVYYCGWGEGV